MALAALALDAALGWPDALYRRIGEQSSSVSPSRWETVAAQRTGFQVRKELVAGPLATPGRVSEWTRS